MDHSLIAALCVIPGLILRFTLCPGLRPGLCTNECHSRHFADRSRQEIAGGRIPVARLHPSP
ncbi:hypothetical protein [Undibacterium aquatile]|uniref:Uncharacterized protein n=1 Tax=Undibacterium aquatile TaxID=1537398 RepID=A0ABR6XLS3_9BURK|nr:hypothetical protein [Undibacterium aquatile]MBC3813224.1 hypothetical protein [Undibacterium aquatile]